MAADAQWDEQVDQPNVDLSPIDQSPYCAVAVVPTPLRIALGLRTDPDARVPTETGSAKGRP